MTSAWKALETLTAWSDDMRLCFDSERRRFVSEYTFLSAEEFHLWRSYNSDTALVYSYSADLLGRVSVAVDIGYFLEQRFKSSPYGMRKAQKNSESEV